MKRSLFLLAVIATVVVLAPKASYAHRYFDAWAARWTTPDPMLHLYPGWSPYSYGLDNPLRLFDPNGDSVVNINGQKYWEIDPGVVIQGQQDPNYISGNFTWFTDFNWVMVAPIYGRFHNMRTQIIPTANGARWYEPKPTVNEGIVDLPIGPAGEEDAAGIAEDVWRAITPSRPLSAMGHAARHLEDFREIVPTLTSEDLAKIIDVVRQNAASTEALSNGQTAYQATVEVSGKVMNVRVIESSSGIPRTAYPVNK